MYPYLTLFAFVGAVSVPVFSRKGLVPVGSVGFWSSILVLILFSGLRFDTGFDYFSYFHNWWNQAQDISNLANHQKEPVLFILFNLLGLLGLSYSQALLLISATSIGLKAYVIKKYSVYPLFGVLVFVGDFLLLQEMGQMRSGLAMGFLALALHFLIIGKSSLFFVFYVVACGSHVASIPFVFLYPFVKRKIRPSTSVVLVVFGLVFVGGRVILRPVLEFAATTGIGQAFGVSGHTLRVLAQVEGQSIFTLGTGFSVLLLMISFCFRRRLEQMVPHFREFLWAYIFGVGFLFVSTYLGAPGDRVARMFLFYQVILIPAFIPLLYPRWLGIPSVFCIVLIYSLSKYVLVLMQRADAFVPYQVAPLI